MPGIPSGPSGTFAGSMCAAPGSSVSDGGGVSEEDVDDGEVDDPVVVGSWAEVSAAWTMSAAPLGRLWSMDRVTAVSTPITPAAAAALVSARRSVLCAILRKLSPYSFHTVSPA